MEFDFDTQAAPTLTLDPVTEEGTAPAAMAIPEEKKEPEVLDESQLSPQERQMVSDFAEKISLYDSNMILQYGSGAQKKIADFSASALDNVKTKDLGEIGELLSGVVTELKSFEIEEEEKGIFGFWKRSANKMTAMKAKYDKAEVNVNKICTVLELSLIHI